MYTTIEGPVNETSDIPWKIFKYFTDLNAWRFNKSSCRQPKPGDLPPWNLQIALQPLSV
jgi:hypothetical protein